MNFCPKCAKPLIDAVIDGSIRRCCPDQQCGFVHWANPTPVVACLVETREGVVLAHNVSWPEGMFSIITGFLESNEHPEQCALRETEEELGLIGDQASLIGLYPFDRMNQIIMAYHITAFGQIKLNHELDDFKIVPPQELKPWPFGTGLAVADWLKARNLL